MAAWAAKPHGRRSHRRLSAVKKKPEPRLPKHDYGSTRLMFHLAAGRRAVRIDVPGRGMSGHEPLQCLAFERPQSHLGNNLSSSPRKKISANQLAMLKDYLKLTIQSCAGPVRWSAGGGGGVDGHRARVEG
jgi:hypothetical protein